MQEQVQQQDIKSDDKCIFCKIVKGDIPCAKIFEDDCVLSFLDIAPANKGHALIITKNHYETLLDMPDECLNDLMVKAKKIARAMHSALANEGFNILMNNGKAAGQLVEHVHMHIIPRHNADDFNLNWTHKEYGQGEAEQTAAKIREKIKRKF